MAQSRPRKRAAKKASGSSSSFELPPPEVVVVTYPDAGVSVGARGLEATEVDRESLLEMLPARAEFVSTFAEDAGRLRRGVEALADPRGVPDLTTFISVQGADDPEAVAAALAEHEAVAGAYVKPPAEPAIAPDEAVHPPEPEDVAPPATPDFSARQGYLDDAPQGIAARWAWTRPGGRGAGVGVIDIEGAWRFTHEDLIVNQGGVISGTQSTDLRWRNHGTAVAGEISGDHNGHGILGIAPDSHIRAISIFGPGSSGAIRQAADALQAGDVILIELHRPGPRHGFAGRDDQLGYIAIEWWPDDYAAIRYAIGRGVIVVEAAGNGAENLDDALYDTPATGFPSTWRNPFRGGTRDSGAVLVGAGAPPPGTHGRDHGPDRSRLDFSNWGSRVDCQGWGREVTTTGYGGLQGGAEDVWYTDTFSGTSSASPIVVGAVCCWQGIRRAAGQTLTPAQVRDKLRTTGSAQQDAPSRPASQRIGTRPDLRALAGLKLLKERFGSKEHVKEHVKEVKEAKEHKLEKVEIKERKAEKIEKPEKEKVEVFERKIQIERKPGEFQDRFPATSDVEQRLASLEETVSALTHFITTELRPDLGAGYDDLYGQADAAKQEKDLKDTEKQPESGL